MQISEIIQIVEVLEQQSRELDRTKTQLSEKLEQADRQKDALFNDRTDAIDDLVGKICNVIVTTECETDSK